MQTTNGIPDIIPYVYRGIHIPDIIEHYNADYQKDFPDVTDKLSEYRRLKIDHQNSSPQQELDEIYTLICYNFPELCFRLSARIKDFLGLFAKGCIYENTFDSHQKKKKFSDVNDMKGYRIVLYDKNINSCYQVAELVIHFFEKVKHYHLFESEPLLDTNGFNPLEHPDIIVPKTSPFSLKYPESIKDYIAYPKKSGYQSLHFVVVDEYGNKIEIQIRNDAMDRRAEIGSAMHAEYKFNRYGNILDNFDPTKVHMKGFYAISPSQIIEDTAGLANAYCFYTKSKLF